jgi:toxin ParE1/3/4
MHIVWSEIALNDLDAIIFHVAAENVSAALRMDTDISRHVDLLSDFPWMGRVGRISGTRELVVSRKRCVVMYRLDEDVVRILRVVHGAQQWPASV